MVDIARNETRNETQNHDNSRIRSGDLLFVIAAGAGVLLTLMAGSAITARVSYVTILALLVVWGARRRRTWAPIPQPARERP